MLIWRGCGILVVVLLGLACAGTSIAAERFWGAPLAGPVRSGAVTAGFVLGALLVLGLDLFLRRRAGAHAGAASKHDLFFVPVRFWPYILLVGGAVSLFAR